MILPQLLIIIIDQDHISLDQHLNTTAQHIHNSELRTVCIIHSL